MGMEKESGGRLGRGRGTALWAGRWPRWRRAGAGRDRVGRGGAGIMDFQGSHVSLDGAVVHSIAVALYGMPSLLHNSKLYNTCCSQPSSGNLMPAVLLLCPHSGPAPMLLSNVHFASRHTAILDMHIAAGHQLARILLKTEGCACGGGKQRYEDSHRLQPPPRSEASRRAPPSSENAAWRAPTVSSKSRCRWAEQTRRQTLWDR